MTRVRWEMWFESDVALRLREAARTLTWLNMPENGLPSGYGSSMPEPLTGTHWDVFNNLTPDQRQDILDELNRTRIHPTADQITRMDEVLIWLYWLEGKNRTLVVMHALGLSYRQIAHHDKCSHERIRQVWRRACKKIVVRLNYELTISGRRGYLRVTG
jgi:DNA-directed RNA polymerase specialized sigma24 family protein